MTHGSETISQNQLGSVVSLNSCSEELFPGIVPLNRIVHDQVCIRWEIICCNPPPNSSFIYPAKSKSLKPPGVPYYLGSPTIWVAKSKSDERKKTLF